MFGLLSRIRKTFTRSKGGDRATTAPTTPSPGGLGAGDGGASSRRQHASFSATPNGGTAPPHTFHQQQTPQQVDPALKAALAAQQKEAALLAARKAKFADLIPALGDAPITAFCSSKWQQRVEGLDTVGRMLRAKMHAKRVMGDDKGIAVHYTNVMSLLRRALADKVTPVYFATVDLMNVTLEHGLPASADYVRKHLQPLLPGLLKWMSVNNSRVQEKTLRAFVDMAQHDKIGIDFIAPVALTPYVIKEGHMAPSDRVVETRMTLLLGLLPMGGKDRFPVDKTMKLILPALSSGGDSLRNMGVACAAEVYRHHGKAVPVYTRKLPAEVLRRLDKKFVAIDKARDATEKDPSQAALQDDPLWLLRIQRAGGGNASTNSLDDVHGPAQAAAGIPITPRGGRSRAASSGSAAGVSSGAGAGAGAGSASSPSAYRSAIRAAQPKFKGHDWSQGPPIPRAQPSVRGGGMGGAAGYRSRPTSGASAGGGGILAASRPTSGDRSRPTSGIRLGVQAAPQGEPAFGGFAAAAATSTSGGSGGTGGGTGYSASRTANFGARIMAGASPAPAASTATSRTVRTQQRKWGVASSTTGGGDRYSNNSNNNTRSGASRSVFSNTGAATFSSTTRSTGPATTSSSNTTSTFLPSVGRQNVHRKRMDDADEALMDDILSNL